MSKHEIQSRESKAAERYEKFIFGDFVAALGARYVEWAQTAGLDRSYVGRVERGEHNLTFVSLVKLCRAMSCDVATLTHGLPTATTRR